MARTLTPPPAATAPTAPDAGVDTPPAQLVDHCCVATAEPPLRPDEAARYAGALKAVADPHRLRMLSLLAAQPAGEPLCVCDIEASFDLSQPTVSHHLRVLREAGLVTVTKRGLWHHYALDRSGLAPLRDLLAGLGDAKQPVYIDIGRCTC